MKILPEASLATAANLNEGGSCLGSLIKETVSCDVKPLELSGTPHHGVSHYAAARSLGFCPVRAKTQIPSAGK